MGVRHAPLSGWRAPLTIAINLINNIDWLNFNRSVLDDHMLLNKELLLPKFDLQTIKINYEWFFWVNQQKEHSRIRKARELLLLPSAVSKICYRHYHAACRISPISNIWRHREKSILACKGIFTAIEVEMDWGEELCIFLRVLC